MRTIRKREPRHVNAGSREGAKAVDISALGL
jgi:hypothetical protein